MTTANDAAGATFEHTLAHGGRVMVLLASAELRIRGGATGQVIVRTADGKPFPGRLVLDPTDGGLTIREKKEGFGLAFGLGRTVQLDIQIPAEAPLELNTASGWVETEGLHGEQRFKTASADLRLRAAAGALDLTVVSGDVTVDLDGTATLAVRSVSGDVSVRDGRIDKLRVGTTSGDIRIDSELTSGADHSIETLSGDVELVGDGGIRVDARTVSGDLRSDLPHRTEGRMGSRAMIVGDGSTHVAFRSVSGDLRIRDRSGAGASAGRPAAPTMPTMPTPPTPPTPPRAPSLPPAPGRSSGPDGAIEPSPADDERMTILRALERGELDVATAMARLAELDDEAPHD
jgi:hypothetical protein